MTGTRGARMKSEGKVEALEAMMSWSPDLYGPEPVWLIVQEMVKELRRRIEGARKEAQGG